MSSNLQLQVWGADLFLLEKWDASSPLSDDDQLVNIFSSYSQLPFDQRYAYTQRAKDQGFSKPGDLPQADRDLLSRLRKPEERQALEMIWLRTCYDDGTDEALAAFLQKGRPDPIETTFFQDADRYNYGGEDGWKRIFTRLPQILDPFNKSPEEYEDIKKRALDTCIEREVQDREETLEQGYDPEEDGTYWMELYSEYHYRTKVDMLYVIDKETLDVALENPREAKVLAVWFDNMGRVVRQKRLTGQETWNVEGLEMTMGGALMEHGEWMGADPGEDYIMCV